MAEVTTLGRHLVNKILPPEMRDSNRTFTGDEMESLLTRVGKERPELYKDITHKLMQLGRHASYSEGVTLRLSDTTSPIDRKKISDFVNKQERTIHASDMTPEEKELAIDDLYTKSQKLMEDQTYEGALAAGNPFALQVKSKARGSKGQLAGLLSSPSMFRDAKGKILPVFVSRSYAEGLKPWEYYAATYGARQGAISTKLAVPDAGDLGKQLNVMSANLIVTQDDCGTDSGVPFNVDDPDNAGAILARDVGGFKAGSVMDNKTSEALKKQGIERILLRSPITCNTKDGLCKICTGIRESGKYSNLRDSIGTSASSALAERIAQGSLNVKHCLTPWTIVLCADWTVRRIDELNVGDMIMGSDLQGRMKPVKVLNIFDNGPRECWRTEFIQNGRHEASAARVTLESTLDHKILATRLVVGQKDEALNGIIRQIPVGQRSRQFYAQRPTEFDDTGLQDEPRALLAGLLLGDGCYTESVHGAFFSTADSQLKQELASYLKGNNLKLAKAKGHRYYHRVSGIEDVNKTCPGSNHSNTAMLFLEKHAMLGKYAQEKTVPEAFHTWNNKSVAQLIAGLIITDGSIYPSSLDGKPGVAFTSTSKPMLDQVRYLLGMRFGIWTSEPTITRAAGSIRGSFIQNFDQWQITVTSRPQVLKFAANIPLLGAKAIYLKSLLGKYRHSKKSSYCGLKRIGQSFIGVQPTLDIEVDHPDHLFVLANGLVVSNSGSKTHVGDYAGFPVIDQLVQVPEAFRYRAALATADGPVESVDPAPQGGFNVVVGGQTHYVDPQQQVQVKPGDMLDAGDQISSGILNPAEIVQYKGIGEGRKYLTERLTKAFKDSKLTANRRNVEVVARALINRVDIEEPEGLGDYLPGDSVSYNSVAYSYRPRQDSTMAKPSAGIGKYLEQPALHYTIGTKLTKKMADELDNFKVPQIMVHNEPPGFTPVMERLRGAPAIIGKDWMAKLQGSNLKANLMKDIQYGSESNIHGTHPIPGLAYGVEFGQSKPGKITY